LLADGSSGACGYCKPACRSRSTPARVSTRFITIAVRLSATPAAITTPMDRTTMCLTFLPSAVISAREEKELSLGNFLGIVLPRTGAWSGRESRAQHLR